MVRGSIAGTSDVKEAFALGQRPRRQMSRLAPTATGCWADCRAESPTGCGPRRSRPGGCSRTPGSDDARRSRPAQSSASARAHGRAGAHDDGNHSDDSIQHASRYFPAAALDDGLPIAEAGFHSAFLVRPRDVDRSAEVGVDPQHRLSQLLVVGTKDQHFSLRTHCGRLPTPGHRTSSTPAGRVRSSHRPGRNLREQALQPPSVLGRDAGAAPAGGGCTAGVDAAGTRARRRHPRRRTRGRRWPPRPWPTAEPGATTASRRGRERPPHRFVLGHLPREQVLADRAQPAISVRHSAQVSRCRCTSSRSADVPSL